MDYHRGHHQKLKLLDPLCFRLIVLAGIIELRLSNCLYISVLFARVDDEGRLFLRSKPKTSL